MKLRSTVTVRIESPDGDAVFSVRKLKDNERARLQHELKELPEYEQNERYRERIVALVQDVQGLEHEDGSPVTVEDLQSGNVYPEVFTLLLTGYFAALIEESRPKKASSPSA